MSLPKRACASRRFYLGRRATEWWDKAGLPVRNLPAEIVMSADDLVDAALAGLDKGETVTLPSFPDKAEWDRFEAARRAMSAKLLERCPSPPLQRRASPIRRSVR